MNVDPLPVRTTPPAGTGVPPVVIPVEGVDVPAGLESSGRLRTADAIHKTRPVTSNSAAITTPGIKKRFPDRGDRLVGADPIGDWPGPNEAVGSGRRSASPG